MPNDKSLVRAMNGYPAQTYNPNSHSYEESYGSNNAPHMKVTDPNTGEPIDPREVDMTEVINRLDAIETRLNGVLDTRVTGSNAENGIADFKLNSSGVLLAQIERTSMTTSPIITNYNAKGVYLFFKGQAEAGTTTTLRLVLRAIDQVSGDGFIMADIQGVPSRESWYGIVIYPSEEKTLQSSADIKKHISLPLPYRWTVQVIPSDATPIKYGIGYSTIL